MAVRAEGEIVRTIQEDSVTVTGLASGGFTDVSGNVVLEILT
jgi:hypothetical protein